MNIAVIDLGTNTFHLLIVRPQPGGNPEVLYYEKVAAKIGRGGISQGRLTEDAFARALQTVIQFSKQLITHQVASTNVHATATSAIRNAVNGTELVAEIERQTGIRVQIISGEREARYIYAGVRQAVPIGPDPGLIMDIGGGSVEFIIATDTKLYWKHSFEIGAQRLLDQFMHTDPISAPAVRKLEDFLETQLIPLTNAVHQYAPKRLIGASGAFETLCAIHYQQQSADFDPDTFIRAELPREAFAGIYGELLQKTNAERLVMPGMVAMRADMIVVASILLNFVLNRYSIGEILVSAYALKEGVLYSVLAGEPEAEG